MEVSPYRLPFGKFIYKREQRSGGLAGGRHGSKSFIVLRWGK